MEKCTAVVVTVHGPSYELFLFAMLCWSPVCKQVKSKIDWTMEGRVCKLTLIGSVPEQTGKTFLN